MLRLHILFNLADLEKWKHCRDNKGLSVVWSVYFWFYSWRLDEEMDWIYIKWVLEHA